MAKKETGAAASSTATAPPPQSATSGSAVSDEKKQPVWSKEVKGTKAVIWENEHAGRIFYSFGMTRRYLDKRSEEWKESSSWPDSDADLFELVYDAMKRELQDLKAKLRASGRNESTNGQTPF